MMLEISSFADPGTHEKERVILKALADLDIGNYAVLCSTISDRKSPTAGPKIAYWFPDGDVKSGDLIVLYTKSGQNSKKDIAGDHTAHFYYWSREDTLWGTGKRTAVILRVAEWIHQIS
jgi:hypothetical protein